MQILLGAHETVIKIKSTSSSISTIINFVNIHFQQSSIKNNYIKIPYTNKTDESHRLFLLKWLYTLYTKRTHNSFPKLRESLIQRHSKTITIEILGEVSHKINYKIIDADTINITIYPYSRSLIQKVQQILPTKTTLLQKSIQVKFENNIDRQELQKFLEKQITPRESFEHVFNKKAMYDFLNTVTRELKREEKESNAISRAFLLFNLSQDYDKFTLKKEYKNLAKKYHPDKIMHQSKHQVQEYTQKFQEILHAYNLLSHHATLKQ